MGGPDEAATATAGRTRRVTFTGTQFASQGDAFFARESLPDACGDARRKEELRIGPFRSGKLQLGWPC